MWFHTKPGLRLRSQLAVAAIGRVTLIYTGRNSCFGKRFFWIVTPYLKLVYLKLPT